MTSLVLCATYNISKTFYFKIPDKLDLEDTEIVEAYWIKYNTLYIKYVGKDEFEEIEPCYEDGDPDFKYPDTEDIIEEKDAPYYESEEEEEDK